MTHDKAYMHEHPGGKGCIIDCAGADASYAFEIAGTTKFFVDRVLLKFFQKKPIKIFLFVKKL